jgi:hypothetical protein
VGEKEPDNFPGGLKTGTEMIRKVYLDERKTYLHEEFFLTPLFLYDSIFFFGGRKAKRHLVHGPEFHSASNPARSRR